VHLFVYVHLNLTDATFFYLNLSDWLGRKSSLRLMRRGREEGDRGYRVLCALVLRQVALGRVTWSPER
jgi:hypothetical protein